MLLAAWQCPVLLAAHLKPHCLLQQLGMRQQQQQVPLKGVWLSQQLIMSRQGSPRMASASLERQLGQMCRLVVAKGLATIEN